MCCRPQYTDLIYMGDTGPCGQLRIIFGSIIKSWHTSLNIKFGVNRMFHVLKTHVSFIYFIYMRGTGPCSPMSAIVVMVMKSWYRSLNINLGVKWMFHVL